MTKNEFLNKISNENPNIGAYQIETDCITEASFVLGCYYDGEDEIWKIYETGERGFKSIIFKAADENTAFAKLYKLVGMHERLNE
ncbi:hypothetical protein J7E79_29140 [Bacillus sp. ISL-40]|uniref:hypothetical protein n=1 Tax=unclassified Bacillus (in: firmicutes) TaxID=185979 RepID=UPI001BE6814F|nr:MULTISPECIES: hypothetical protein [unclassified Bacillus (in: firmicutes)]MBT2701323.1 hypothetical protein [Bacillus sp. ISL-40]MBT2719733.1 hypothetical protein [Bacillus sp. ISL-46]MBT2742174.1 hypothetical protein [Bacillus sp. ISL-77]